MKKLILSLTFVTLAGCSAAQKEPPPVHPVTVLLGGQMPEGGVVGSYTVTLDEGWLVLSDWAIYGGYLQSTPAFVLTSGPIVAHAGHSHGEADLSAEVNGVFALDLTGPAVELALLELTEGHYFDGRIRLVTAADETTPRLLPGQSTLSTESPVWGHTLVLAGTADDGVAVIPFEIIVDAESTVAGLEYGANVVDPLGNEIILMVDLEALLAEVEFAALSQGTGSVRVSPDNPDETYIAVKARLNDPATYVHANMAPLDP